MKRKTQNPKISKTRITTLALAAAMLLPAPNLTKDTPINQTGTNQ